MQKEKKRPTILDVAQEAGVSAATVSNVLNARRNVDSTLAKRVHDVVERIGYRVDPVAANLRRAKPFLVGLVVPDFSNPFFGELVGHIERLAERDGYRLTVMSSREDADLEKTRIQALSDWRAAGLILVSVGGKTATPRALEESGLPTVFVDRPAHDERYDSVIVDNAKVSGDALSSLVDAGHKRILVAASSKRVPNMADRIRGTMAKAEQRGVAAGVEVLECGASGSDAHKVLGERLARAPRPTAVLTLYNIATLETLRVLNDLHLDIPADISVVGFDDAPWMEVSRPPLTAVEQPVEKLAEAAWTRLVERIDGKGLAGETRSLPCNLINRASVAAPADAQRPTETS